MDGDRKTLDLTQQIKGATAAGRPPPAPQRRVTPAQTAAVRPPPPVRAKQPERESAGGPAAAAPPRIVSPNPAEMAFARTLVAPTTPVVRAEPAVRTTPPVSIQEPEPLPEALPLPAQPEPLPEPQAQPEAPHSLQATTTEPLQEEELRPPMNPRPSAGWLIGIAVGAVVGIGAGAFFGLSGHATSTAKAAAPIKAPAVPATPQALPAEPAAQVGNAESASPSPPAPPPAAAADAPPTLAPAQEPDGASAPSCQELLGSAHVEKRDPTAAFAQTQLGKRELVRGNAAGAQTAFCKAALWDDANAERWLNLAQVFLLRRDGAKAAASAETVLRLQANHSRALAMLGDAAALLGKTSDARKAYLAAENSSEPDAAGLRLMVKRDLEEARRSLKGKDFARAERVFRRVLVFDAANSEASAGLSTCLAKLGVGMK